MTLGGRVLLLHSKNMVTLFKRISCVQKVYCVFISYNALSGVDVFSAVTNHVQYLSGAESSFDHCIDKKNISPFPLFSE